MTAKRKILTGIGIIFVIAVIAALGLPILTAGTNCGGNSFALSACGNFALVAESIAAENNSQFTIARMSDDEKKYLSMLAKSHWVNGADFLIRTNFSSLKSPRGGEIVIVCEETFGNVPQPTIWNLYHRNPAHAVGYSNGTTGLISPEQFADLNLTGFVLLSNLATNFEFNISKP